MLLLHANSPEVLACKPSLADRQHLRGAGREVRPSGPHNYLCGMHSALPLPFTRAMDSRLKIALASHQMAAGILPSSPETPIRFFRDRALQGRTRAVLVQFLRLLFVARINR